MAIRKREGRASPYQVYWNNPFTGKRECANFTTEEEARKHDSLIKHRLRFERESFKPDEIVEENKQEVLTLEQVYLLYLREKQFSKSNLSRQLCAMDTVLSMLGNRDILAISTHDIRQVYERLNSRKLKMVTVVYRMKKLFTLLRWAAEHDYCKAISFPKMPHMVYEEFIPPTPCEIQAIFTIAPQHIKRVIILGSQCGVRVGACEMLKLTWDDIDFEQHILRIHGAKKNLNSDWREVPIKEGLLPLFLEWHKVDRQHDCKYIVNYKGRPILSIKRAWKNVLTRAGIVRRIRPYDLRHAFATELIAGGADIGTVAKLMGHSSPTMLLNHYQYVMDKQKRAAIEALPNIDYVPKAMCPNNKGLQPSTVTP